jgi:cell division protein FtsQ
VTTSTRSSAPRTGSTRARPRRTVVPAADRIAARARAERSMRRHRLARRVATGLLALGAVAAIAWVVLGSGWLAVDRVTVTGTERLTPEVVARTADVRLGAPLATVDTGEVAARVGELAPVAAVDVVRSWPGTLRIAVTERSAVAVHAGRGGLQLVDATGVAFAAVREAPDGLVRLQVDRAAPDDPATVAALAVNAELPADLRAQVAVVAAESPASVTLRLHDGREVVWGRPGNAATKAAAAKALLAMPGRTVDVSAPGVAVRR